MRKSLLKTAVSAVIVGAVVALSSVAVFADSIIYKKWAHSEDVSTGETSDSSFFTIGGWSDESGALSKSVEIAIDGNNYTFTKKSRDGAGTISFTVEDGKEATVYLVGVSNGGTQRNVTIKATDNGNSFEETSETKINTKADSANLVSFSKVPSGNYTISTDGNWAYSFIEVKLEDTEEISSNTYKWNVDNSALVSAGFKGTVSVTGTGKTVTAIKIMNRLFDENRIRRVVITMYGNDLLDQWSTQMREEFQSKQINYHFGTKKMMNNFIMHPDDSILLISRDSGNLTRLLNLLEKAPGNYLNDTLFIFE